VADVPSRLSLTPPVVGGEWRIIIKKSLDSIYHHTSGNSFTGRKFKHTGLLCKFAYMKYYWSYISTAAYNFTTWCLIKHSANVNPFILGRNSTQETCSFGSLRAAQPTKRASFYLLPDQPLRAQRRHPPLAYGRSTNFQSLFCLTLTVVCSYNCWRNWLSPNRGATQSFEENHEKPHSR
jgi:hypothetical protein